MKILSLNAWHGTQESELRDFLTAQLSSTDVFCFQEADGSSIERTFKDIFPEIYFQEISAKKISGRESYCLRTFVRQGIEVVGHDALLGESGGDSGYCLITHLREDGTDFYVANVHGAPYPGDKLDTDGRIQQSRVILQYLDERDGPKIICGDFNLQPHTESIALFRRAGFADLISDYDIATTRNELAWRKYPDNKQLFADYAFVSQDVLLHDFRVPNNRASDHLPLLIELDAAVALVPKTAVLAGLPATQR